MIFWLMLKLEIKYRVIISWKIFVSFRGFFGRLYFCMVKYLSFHNSSFALRCFLVCMARPQCDTPLISFRGVGILLFPICSQPVPQHVPNSSSVYPIFFCHKFYSYDLYNQPLVNTTCLFWDCPKLDYYFLWWTNE